MRNRLFGQKETEESYLNVNKKKPSSDNKSLFYRAQQQNSLQTAINANSKPQQVLMLSRSVAKLKKTTRDAFKKVGKALQRGQVAPGAKSNDE